MVNIGKQPYKPNGDAKDDLNSIERFKNGILPNIEKYLRGSLLDVGCGNGRISNEIKSYFESIDAIDPAEMPHGDFKDEKINFIRSDLFSYSTEKQYDVIMLYGVFYLFYQEGYEKAWAKVDALLSETGSVVIFDNQKRKISTDHFKGHYNLDRLCGTNFSIVEEFVQEQNIHRISVIRRTHE